MSSNNTVNFSESGTESAGSGSSSSGAECSAANSLESSAERTRSVPTCSRVSAPSASPSSFTLAPLGPDELKQAIAPAPVTHKECNTCHEMRPLETFVLLRPKKDGRIFRNPKCNRCRVVEERKQPATAPKWDLLVALRSKPCVDCGTQYPAVCMDFDHRPTEKKAFNISQQWRSISFAELKAETDKCDVVCANCHRIRTADRGYIGHGQPRKRRVHLAEIPRGGALSWDDVSSPLGSSTGAPT